jgi:hypothetical protein
MPDYKPEIFKEEDKSREFRIANVSEYLYVKVIEKMEKEGIRKKPDLLHQLLRKWIEE